MIRNAAKFILLPLLLRSAAAAQHPPSFRAVVLRFAGPVSIPVLADMDGDGFADLIVGRGASGSAGGAVDCYLNRNGAFAPRPDESLDLPAGTALFDVTGAERGIGSAVWVLTPDAVRVRRFPAAGTADSADAGPSEFRVRTAFPETASDRPAAWPFASLLRGPEGPVLLLPEPGGIRPFRPFAADARDSGKVLAAIRFLRSSGRDGAPVFSFELPGLVRADWDGDGVRDAALTTTGAPVLLREAGGSIEELEEPAFVAGWGGDPASRPRTREFEFRDFDGDGRTDVLVVEAPGPGLLTPAGWVRLHLNRNGVWDAAPDQVLVKNRFFGDRAIADFNGDGRPDLCLVTLESGTADIVRYGLTRRVKNRFDFHYGRPDGRFGQKPDRSVTLAFGRTLSDLFSEPPVRRPFAGDFDGDGRDDIGVWTGANDLSLIPAGKKGPMDTGAALRLRFPETDRVQVLDLNRDGRSDLVLSYPDDPSGAACVLLISAGAGR